MSLELILAGIMLVSLTFYALLGGADFGAGAWVLLARGPRGAAQEQLIARAIAPIWEANHVWLILVVTILFTAFPPAFATITTRLHIPLTFMLIGIVLRGAAFAFRSSAIEAEGGGGYREGRRWERLFAVASLLTPILLGVTIGAIASGSLRTEDTGFLDLFVWDWLAPFPIAVGFFALALFAFLAAVYLTVEAKDPHLQEDFRRRALASAGVVAILAVIVFVLSKRGAPGIPRDLSQSWWGWSLLLLAVIMALGAVFGLWRRRFVLARFLAAGEVVAILWGWALAQFPFLVEPTITIYNAAASPQTLRLLLVAIIAGVLLLFPSLYYLYRVFKRHALLPPSTSKADS
jgi:cytochrome d ubiquinol oxidase subunit II